MHALVRHVPASFARALAANPVAIDVSLARRQHAAYRAALAELGLVVTELPADDALPDCCFVEDTAVVAGGLAVITRPGAPSRQGEIVATAEALGDRMELARIVAPGTLDGGDCMRVGKRVFVGRSARTNAEGIAQLAELLAPRGVRVIAVDMPADVLHLKCVCAPLGDDRITLVEGTLALPDVAIVPISREESYAANVLAVGDRVLVADGFPRTRQALEAAGLRTTALDTSEFRKADGALTCLSVLTPE